MSDKGFGRIASKVTEHVNKLTSGSKGKDTPPVQPRASEKKRGVKFHASTVFRQKGSEPRSPRLVVADKPSDASVPSRGEPQPRYSYPTDLDALLAQLEGDQADHAKSSGSGQSSDKAIDKSREADFGKSEATDAGLPDVPVLDGSSGISMDQPGEGSNDAPVVPVERDRDVASPRMVSSAPPNRPPPAAPTPLKAPEWDHEFDDILKKFDGFAIKRNSKDTTQFETPGILPPKAEPPPTITTKHSTPPPSNTTTTTTTTTTSPQRPKIPPLNLARKTDTGEEPASTGIGLPEVDAIPEIKTTRPSRARAPAPGTPRMGHARKDSDQQGSEPAKEPKKLFQHRRIVTDSPMRSDLPQIGNRTPRTPRAEPDTPPVSPRSPKPLPNPSRYSAALEKKRHSSAKPSDRNPDIDTDTLAPASPRDREDPSILKARGSGQGSEKPRDQN